MHRKVMVRDCLFVPASFGLGVAAAVVCRGTSLWTGRDCLRSVPETALPLPRRGSEHLAQPLLKRDRIGIGQADDSKEDEIDRILVGLQVLPGPIAVSTGAAAARSFSRFEPSHEWIDRPTHSRGRMAPPRAAR